MSKQNDIILLESFNRRNPKAFSIVYRMIYRELYLYATRLFESLNVPAEDVIQDIFTDIWLRESVQFPSILYIGENVLYNVFCRNIQGFEKPGGV